MSTLQLQEDSIPKIRSTARPWRDSVRANSRGLERSGARMACFSQPTRAIKALSTIRWTTPYIRAVDLRPSMPVGASPTEAAERLANKSHDGGLPSNPDGPKAAMKNPATSAANKKRCGKFAPRRFFVGRDFGGCSVSELAKGCPSRQHHE
jgi:hypothetical protein